MPLLEYHVSSYPVMKATGGGRSGVYWSDKDGKHTKKCRMVGLLETAGPKSGGFIILSNNSSHYHKPNARVPFFLLCFHIAFWVCFRKIQKPYSNRRNNAFDKNSWARTA